MDLVPDLLTINLHLGRPIAEFDHLVCMPQTAPVPPAKDTGADYHRHPPSSGPYLIHTYTPLYAADHVALQDAFGGAVGGVMVPTMLPSTIPSTLPESVNPYGLLSSPRGDLRRAAGGHPDRVRQHDLLPRHPRRRRAPVRSSCAPRRTAAGILVGLDRDRYEVLPVRIGRDGVWAGLPTMPSLLTVEEVLRWQQNSFPETGDTTPAASILPTARELTRCDVVFPALHGPYGKDGAVQAMLEWLEIPYVGNGVAASALSMDNEYTKKVAAAGLAVAEGVVLRKGQHDVGPEDRARLGLPVFVKPAREGSSIGVSKVEEWTELPDALDRARKSDEKVLVEAAVPGREIDIGVLERPDGDLEASPPMEIRPSTEHAFFDYQAKYADSATVFDVPADLDPATAHATGQDALRLFRELGCSGLLSWWTPPARRVADGGQPQV